MAGFEPAVSRARGVRFGRAKLHPGIGAHDEDRTRLPGSTVRSLRQMGTWANGALGRDRTGMVSHRPLKTARLPVSPRARIELEDLVGLEPTVTLRRRIKNPLPWPLGAQVRYGGSGWFRTTCARVKNPLHLHSGLTLRIHRLDGCGGQPRRFRVARRDGIAPGLCSSKRGLALGGKTMHAGRQVLGHGYLLCCLVLP